MTQALRTYTLDDKEANLALTVYGDGETTTARYGQFKDNQYYLYLLDTLDYALKWGNYSANNRPEPNHQGFAREVVVRGVGLISPLQSNYYVQRTR